MVYNDDNLRSENERSERIELRVDQRLDERSAVEGHRVRGKSRV